jgi:hypothetical protein
MLFNNYAIVDNILEDPDSYIQLAKNTGYEYNSKFPCRLQGIRVENELPIDNPFNWRGFRSLELHVLNQQLFSKTFNRIFTKLFSNLSVVSYNYHVSSYLHYNSSDIGNWDEWWHIDIPYIFAGVIYLSKNPEPNSGTIIRLEDNSEVVVDNVFNRLIFYNSNLLHRPQRCFGTTVDNARLTLVFFIKNLAIWKP